ncbi:heme A synthase [Chachezhania sediminis]|uniref:heme A synthase n=1 Tax=Chachezhania sediminis TaxID=2599291 RepID=UPI00131BB44E|nr:heme A synthase [Chachezhania sediminis]
MSGKRSIFEEVGEAETTRPAVQPGAIDRGRGGKGRTAIRIWLAVLFLLVLAMIAVGGMTRLTDSGLSITEWKPITGALPPMTEAHWQAEFDLYQTIDEFQLVNSWMTLADFKYIYWWEWSHRQLGRIVGLVWAVGFLAFLALKMIPRGWGVRLAAPGILGGVQGAIGWWMVSSGVTSGEGMVDVASYRLATHLGLAFVILGLLAWDYMLIARDDRVLMQARRLREPGLVNWTTVLLVVAFIQILLGALVAGIDAGRSYPDWPLMGGQFFPEDALTADPFWRNFFESAGLVQFIHRCTAYLLLLLTVLAFASSRRSAHPRSRHVFSTVLAVVILQAGLGIMTLLYFVPLHLALTHQLGAVLVLTMILRARVQVSYPVTASIRGDRK